MLASLGGAPFGSQAVGGAAAPGSTAAAPLAVGGGGGGATGVAEGGEVLGWGGATQVAVFTLASPAAPEPMDVGEAAEGGAAPAGVRTLLHQLQASGQLGALQPVLGPTLACFGPPEGGCSEGAAGAQHTEVASGGGGVRVERL